MTITLRNSTIDLEIFHDKNSNNAINNSLFRSTMCPITVAGSIHPTVAGSIHPTTAVVLYLNDSQNKQTVTGIEMNLSPE